MIYCFVARTRSFSKAAKILGVSRSLVSKRISRLENRLGARLLNRSTRSLSLTEAGELLYRRYSDIHERIEQAEQQVSDLHKTSSGTIRFAAPTVSSYVGVPLISDFHREYPNIDIRLSVVDDEFDLINSGYDAAIHIGELKSSNLICRKITTVRLAVCATPAYVDANGRPMTPYELDRHNCLCLGSEQGNDKKWLFRGADDETFGVQIAGKFSANNELILLRACLAGLGFCQLPLVLLEPYIDSGKLEVVLDEFSNVYSDIYVVLPHRDITEKVRIVVDFLTNRISERFTSGSST